MRQDAVELGEHRPQPHGALGHLHAEHLLDREDDAELVAERAEPVVAVGEHDDLPVVADLEELLRATVHVADDRLGLHDALAVEGEAQPEHAVGRRVLRADVEHHVGRREPAGADGDRGRPRRRRSGMAPSMPRHRPVEPAEPVRVGERGDGRRPAERLARSRAGRWWRRACSGVVAVRPRRCSRSRWVSTSSAPRRVRRDVRGEVALPVRDQQYVIGPGAAGHRHRRIAIGPLARYPFAMPMPPQDKRAWVLAALEEFELRLLRYALRLLGDESSARDAVQHAFLRLCGESPDEHTRPLAPWLFAVVREPDDRPPPRARPGWLAWTTTASASCFIRLRTIQRCWRNGTICFRLCGDCSTTCRRRKPKQSSCGRKVLRMPRSPRSRDGTKAFARAGASCDRVVETILISLITCPIVILCVEVRNSFSGRRVYVSSMQLMDWVADCTRI